MICPKCQYDRLEVVRVYRNTVIDNNGINNVDKRIIRCNSCNSYYETETRITGKIKPNLDGKKFLSLNEN